LYGAGRNPTVPGVFTKAMGETRTTTPVRRRRAVYVAAFAVLCAALVTVVGVTSAGASRAKVIGKTKHTPGPTCPKRCNGIGRVTGFMTEADGQKHPFNVFKDGKIVAFAVDLGKPKKSQRSSLAGYFQNKQYGKAPTFRLSILKHVNGKRSHDYKLVRQSPVVNVKSVLGRKQIFTLDKPLSVRKGQVVAMTSPTWVVNFFWWARQQQSGIQNNKWRGSRQKGECQAKDPTDPKSVRRWARKSHPQQKVGSTHTYGCLYSGGRLLYWAYLVPNKK
jgi:hypothetical protein